MQERTQNRVYSPKFKISFVEGLRNNNLALFEAIHKCFDASVNPNNIKNGSEYLEEVIDGLMKERKDRKVLMTPKVVDHETW